MKILVVDDHALVREGLRQVLKGLGDSVEVLDAGVCTQAFELAQQHPDLDVVLLDYHLPDLNGLEALRVFGRRHPELPVIMLSGSVNPLVVRQVMDGGAAAFLTKSGLSHELLDCVASVLRGEVYTPPDVATHGMAGFPPEAVVGNGLSLTPRQEEVLHLLMGGSSNKDIGRALNVSEETVKNHVSGLLRAFGVQTRSKVVATAIQLGYSNPLSPP
ncbi:MAG: response regulator transcription factor [Burkholderiaceae bacterium]|nr:response regulator transcription factor [Burkholderiaceae bacterium]MDP3424251.1 response regulator transcription factor [Burkholderiaceae bacterium]MDZ4160594.1 response regulator transcription factor [Burkholderiales bacterium]